MNESAVNQNKDPTSGSLHFHGDPGHRAVREWLHGPGECCGARQGVRRAGRGMQGQEQGDLTKEGRAHTRASGERLQGQP